MKNCENSRFHHIKVTGTPSELRPSIELDGKKLLRVNTFQYSLADGEFPEAKISIVGPVELDIDCESIKLDITPLNVHDSIIILRNELLKHGELYNGFHASILSALKDYGYMASCVDGADNEIAHEILNRIIG